MPIRFLRLAGLALAAVPLPLLACEGRLHIELQQSGVYSLDYAAIVAEQRAHIERTATALGLKP